MITINQIIHKIETRQAVVNKQQLDDGQLSRQITEVASLDKANSSSLTFLAKDKFVVQLANTQAGVVLVSKNHQQDVPKSTVALVVQSPYLAYASCSQLFDKLIQPSNQPSIHPTAIIDDTAVIGENVTIGAYSIVGANTQIGKDSIIEHNVCIERDCQIGTNAVIKSNVVIAEQCQLGDNVRIHAGASIGSEGFGFAPMANSTGADPAGAYSEKLGWERIAQLGRVIVGNNVRIGANTTVDRGAIDDTIIGDNVIIDNLVQIAHNVHIGAGSAIAANTGIAGSSKLGKRCIIGGAVGIAGHLQICDDVTVTGMSMVTKSINKSGSYSSGNAAMPSNEWRRAFVKLRQMGRK
ncbi:MAG: UDP-3-O-(3-hydroxymyristoyl)glucosamine N-acyltransferase [Pseudomonadales bacterium]|nr:MAG: UDP-3-O-(3-hydroxymyristoyl)glucosamine N-acyltransferase [Pseudomonadales bacterium]